MSLALLRQLKQLTARLTHWHLRWLSRLGLALMLVLMICALSWQFYLVPRLQQYQPWLAQELSQSIGAPVKIGTIEGGWRGIRPHLEISRFELLNQQGQPALQFERVAGTLSWWHLLIGDINFRHLKLIAPQLDIVRLKSGEWQWAGITLANTASASHDSQILDWLLDQGELTIVQGQLRLSDQRAEFPTLSANNVQLNVQNWFSQHDAVLKFSPAQLSGAPVEISAKLKGASVAQLKQWSGWVKLNLPQANLSHAAPWLKPIVPALNLRTGQGALALQLDIAQGVLEGLDAQLKLAQWRLNLPQQAEINLPLFDGRILWRDSGERRVLEVKAKQILGAAGPLCQRCELQYVQTPATQSLTARNWTLSGLSAYAAYLPAALTAYRDAQLGGVVDQLSIEWPGAWPWDAKAKAPKWSDLKIELQAQQLAWTHWANLPAVKGLDIDLQLEPRGGRLKLLGQNAQMTYPEQFLEPMNFSRLQTDLDWQREGAGWRFNLGGLKALSKELDLTAQGQYHWPGSGLGQVDLKANIDRLDANRVYAYLPRVLGDDVLIWLKTSLLAGEANKGQLIWRGDVAQFPYTLGTPAAKAGQFTVQTHADDITIHYGNDWPLITKVNGKVVIDGMKLSVDAQRGDITGTSLHEVQVTIPNLEHDQHVLVDGKVKGQTSQFLDFVANSPVRLATEGFLDRLKAQGNGDLKLQLDIPIDDFEKTKINGVFNFAANQLNFGPAIPVLSQAKGAVSFTESTMKVLPSTAKALGGSVALQGETDAKGVLNLALKGQADLAQALHYYAPPLSPWLQGSVPFNANLRVDEQHYALNLASDLQGGQVLFPSPLAKNPAQSKAFKLKVNDDNGATRLSFSYGKALHAAISLPEASAETRGKVLLAVETGPDIDPAQFTLPEKGIQIAGFWPQLNLSEWLPMQALAKPRDTQASAKSPSITINQLAFDQLHIAGKLLSDVRLSGALNAQAVTANFNSRQVVGNVQWNTAQNRVSAQLSKLWLPLKNSPLAVPERNPKVLNFPPLAEVAPRPALDEWLSWPAMQLVAEDFRFKDVELGALSWKSQPQSRGIDFDELSLKNADGQIALTGQWLKQGNGERTQAKVNISSPNMGKLLLRIGYPEAMKAAPLVLHGDGQWQGPPWQPDWTSVNGKLSLTIGAGQFLKLEPGVGRFLSILSLQALPRRLKLDFSDVFSSGFEFDEISGNALIEQGVARTQDLKINGPAAKVRFVGDANFVAGTQRLQVRVVPSISGAVALGVGVVNPLAGLATLAVQSVMDNPLGELLAYEFQIDGSMSDPQVKKLGVKPAAPLLN